MQFDHYTIRLLTLQDLEAYYELVATNRKRLEDFFAGTVARTATLESTRNFLEEITGRIKERTYFPYIITDNLNSKLAGFIDLKNIDWNLPKSELGLYMDEAYANKGIATKAFHVFCEFCFDHYQFQKLFLRTHQTNSAAQRLAEHCGFEKEGVIRRDYKTTAGELVDLIYYGRLR